MMLSARASLSFEHINMSMLDFCFAAVGCRKCHPWTRCQRSKQNEHRPAGRVAVMTVQALLQCRTVASSRAHQASAKGRSRPSISFGTTSITLRGSEAHFFGQSTRLHHLPHPATQQQRIGCFTLVQRTRCLCRIGQIVRAS